MVFIFACNGRLIVFLAGLRRFILRPNLFISKTCILWLSFALEDEKKRGGGGGLGITYS
jgi:hypothetical protein